MRILPILLLLLAALAASFPLRAEETFSESVTAKAQPLLKALSMLGTPYKFGGNNPKKGLDCSGFVKHVYKESADISLPRSAKDMSHEGYAVTKAELEPGDLVFFNTRKRANSHVGIYAGNGEFVHASSSHTKQVTVSRIDQKYWATRFNGARRVLPALSIQ
ncbi:MAG: peptidase C40 [Hydrogenophilales bacterium CG17_big_fil_post_rev_8_21_14_2_50_63_12]|nr:MAG: peptidase C40 [Hydrogenophilales bacterium CG17_big_fil_post_rev_8_21_14_2_50_63_12]PIX96355.1 MAG: peptidase C40 [Hydrogenophilales bacterium CG_4_10_14_3_um_filter_63_21]PJB07929.1 MAG: peptidase C40 [Hydrogenophilales bacterium CG_4_9_14_3_um_filter_63_34]